MKLYSKKFSWKNALRQQRSMFSYTILNTNSSSDHDCEKRDHVHCVLGFTLSAEVKIGEASHVEAGVPVIQGVHVGSLSLVVAGAVEIHDVLEESKVIGIPAPTSGSNEFKN